MIEFTCGSSLDSLEFSLPDDALALGFAQREGARPCKPIKISDREGAALRRAGGQLYGLLRDQAVPGAALRAADLAAQRFTPDELLAFFSGFELASYQPPRWNTGNSAVSEPVAGTGVASAGVTSSGATSTTEIALEIINDAPSDAGLDLPDVLRDVVAQTKATILARNLAHTPSNLKNPQWFAQRVEELAEPLGLGVRVLDEEELAELGFGGILAVGAGSASPPRLVAVEYRPALDWPAQSQTTEPQTTEPQRTEPQTAEPHPAQPQTAEPQTAQDAALPHAVLVGKGITFDTGGISIKPREAMMLMKTDMSGAAAVLGAVLAAAELKLPVQVTAVLPLAENHFGGASYRPGDVLRMYDGRTLEVENTDAEGRVVLYDAMTWAVAQYQPDYLVDIATLTGAVTIGLGRSHAALYGTPLAVETLERAAARTGENVWHFPLVADYLVPHPSSVADLQQYPKNVKGGGSITAALLLREAAKLEQGHQWAHLDIAGTGRADEDGDFYVAGATGYGAALLTQWVAELASKTS